MLAILGSDSHEVGQQPLLSEVCVSHLTRPVYHTHNNLVLIRYHVTTWKDDHKVQAGHTGPCKLHKQAKD